MDFRGNRERTLRQYQQSRATRGDIVVILLVLILAGMWIYYLGVHITGFSVLEPRSATSATLVFENQSLPLGAMLDVTIDGKKYQKDVSLLLQPPYEIEYDNATVYGWNEPLAVDIVSFVPGITPGTHTVDVALSAADVLLAMKTTTIIIAEQTPETHVPVEEKKDEPSTAPIPPSDASGTETSQEPAVPESTISEPEPAPAKIAETEITEETKEPKPISEPTFVPSGGPLFSTAVAGEGTRNWNANFTSAQTKADQFFGVASDTLGNIYAVGVGVNITQGCTSGINCDDMWIKKFRSDGTENTTAWNKTMIKGIANGVAVDNATNSVYVVGYYRGGFGNNDWWIQKFTETGTLNTSWNFTFSGSGNADDRAQAVTVDSLGSVYVVGYGTNLAGASSSLDWWVKKFTEIGTQNTSPWNINFTSPGSSSDAALGVATDSNNNVYVVGYGASVGAASTGDNWWVKKFTEAGTENTSAWNLTFTTPGAVSDRPRGVAVDSNNIVYVAGYAYNATTTCAGSTKCREWMLKSFREVGTENTTAWNLTFNSNGSQHDEAAGIAIDKNDNIYAAGFGFNTTGTCSGTTCEDWWVKKFSAAGTENAVSWNLSFDGAGNDEAFGVVADGIFNVTVAGYLTTSGSNQDLWTIQIIGNSSAGGGGGGDTIAPTVTLVSPATGALANFSERELNFSWNVTDDIQTTLACNLTILNSTSAPNQYRIFNRAVDNGTTVNKSFLAGMFVNGTLNWTVNCTDATNVGNVSANTFTVDLSPPTVNLMEPQNSTGFNTGTDAINFSFNTTDAQDSALNCNLTIGNGSDYKLTNFLTSGSGVANKSFYVDNLTNSTHNWTVNCTNDATGVTNAGIRFFTVDRAAPIVTLIAPADNTFYNFSTGEPNFTWNVTDDINITLRCDLLITNGSDTKNTSIQSTNGTLSNRTYLSGDFTNATHTWEVMCTDGGNNVVASASRTFTVDQHPPAIVFINPANNSGFNFSDAVINFTFNANDTLDGTLDCNITIGNGSDYKLINLQATNGTLANYSLFANNFTNSTHNWTVNCTDTAGGANTSGIQFFTVDQKPPFVSLQQPADSVLFNFSGGVLNFTWNITEDVNTTALCNLSIANGSANFKNITVQTTNNTLTNFSLFANNFTNASHTWFVFCSDNAQGVGNSSTRTFTVDQHGPAIVLAAPANGSYYNFSTGELNFTFNANDTLDGTLSCNLTIGNGSDYKVINVDAANGTLTNFSLLTNNVTNATHNWTVNCTDNAGNINASGRFFFTVDRQLPAVNLLDPANNTAFNFSDGVLNFTWNTTDDINTTLLCNLSVANGSANFKNVTVQTTNNTNTNTSFFSNNFTNATHLWQVTCVDGAGNVQQSAGRTFTVDQAPPVITLIAPSDNTFYNFSTGEPNFTWNVTDDINTSVICNLSIANGSANFRNVSTQSTNGTLSNRSFLSGNFTNASHSWIVTCTDNAQGVGNATARTFTVDQHGPAIVLAAPANGSSYNFTTGELNFTFNANDTLDATLACNLTIGNGSDYKLINLNANNGTLTNFSLFSGNFTDSTHNWTVNCTDDAGTTNTSGSFFFSVDQNRPSVTTIAPRTGTTKASGTLVEVAANVSDTIAVSVVLANLTWPNGTQENKTLSLQSGTNYNNSYAFPNVTGTINLTITANDTSGNKNITEGVNITLTDQTIPILTNASPSNGSSQTKDATIQLSVNVTDNINVSNVSVNITYPNGSVVQKSTNNPSTAFYNTSLLLQSEGVHNVTFAANDTSDNRQTIGINFNSTATEVCQTLTTGKNLTSNIAAAGSGVCILVNGTSNIVFDCKGFNMTSDGTASAIGVRIYNASNVNISNCGIQNFDKAIEFINATASGVNNNIITNSTSKDIVVNQSTKPLITNTTAATTEVQDVSGFEVEKSQGKVTFISSFNGSLGNISQLITFANGEVFVNSTAATSLNRSANITLANLTRFIGKIIEVEADYNDDGVFETCTAPTCTILSFTDATATVVFNVSRFSKYRINEGSGSSIGGGDRGARTIRGTTGTPPGGGGGGGGGSGGGPSGAPLQSALAAPESAVSSSFLDALVSAPVQQELTNAVGEGVLEQFSTQLAPAEIRLPPVPQGTNYAWLVPLLLPLLLAVTSLSVPTPRRVFCDEDTLYQLIRTKKISQYKKLYITQAMKQKADPENHYTNLIPLPFSNNEKYLINYLCERSNASRAIVELLFAAQKKKHAKVITTASIPAVLQARFKHLKIVSPAALEQTKASAFGRARPLFLHALPGMLAALRLKKQQPVDSSLLNYILTARTKGVVADEVAQRLVTTGWKPDMVRAALAQSDARLAALYNYVEQAKAKGLDDTQITQRVVKQGWQPRAARAALQSIEAAFSELLTYVRQAKNSGISPPDIIKRLAAQGWEEKVASEEMRRFNTALSKLVSYINNARLHGLSNEEIQQRLVNFGWEREEVSEQLLLVQLRVERLAQYIQQAKATGVRADAILERLTAMGWNKKEISSELKELEHNEKSLLSYLRRAKAQGVSDGEIKKRLLSEGWDIALIETDLRLVAGGMQRLIEYMSTAKQSGMCDQTIVERLVSDGWEETDVQHELERFKNAMELLVQYITDAHITGVSDGEIHHRLKETGWGAKDIAGAFQLAALSSPPADAADAAAAKAS